MIKRILGPEIAFMSLAGTRLGPYEAVRGIDHVCVDVEGRRNAREPKLFLGDLPSSRWPLIRTIVSPARVEKITTISTRRAAAAVDQRGIVIRNTSRPCAPRVTSIVRPSLEIAPLNRMASPVRRVRLVSAAVPKR